MNRPFRHSDVAAAIAALRHRFGERAATSDAVREHHARDESCHAARRPDIVVFAEATHEVAEIARIASAFHVPIVPFGAGSGLEGAAIPVFGGISLDTSRLDAILEIRADDMIARVQAGVRRHALNHHLRDTGLFFPVDPGADASIGGMVATGASGTNAVRFGVMRENVLGLTVVLADGRVIRTGGLARKSSAGYDLTRLFVGSEGTLGIVTEVTLRLHPIPDAVSATVGFPTLAGAVAAVVDLRRADIALGRVELLDEATIAVVGRHSDLGLEQLPTLFLEFHGDPAEIAAIAATVAEIVADNGGIRLNWRQGAAEARTLWDARRLAPCWARAEQPGAASWPSDVCVPISALAEVVEETRADAAVSPVPAYMFGHVGDGNFHCLFVYDANDPAKKTEVARLSDRIVARALAAGGTSTGEHGIGLGKRQWLEREHGGDAVAVMRALKSTLDPLGLLNPGKIFSETPALDWPDAWLALSENEHGVAPFALPGLGHTPLGPIADRACPLAGNQGVRRRRLQARHPGRRTAGGHDDVIQNDDPRGSNMTVAISNVETLALHGGSFRVDPANGATQVPIYQSTSFDLQSTARADRLVNFEEIGFIYSRVGNPTQHVLEERLAAIEGGAAALALASGQAATALSVLTLVQAGDNIVTSTDLYGGTWNFFANRLKQFGIEARFVDPTDPENFRRATDDKTRLYFGETLPNPKLNVFPIREVSDIGRSFGVPLIIDNTSAPLLARPIEHGAAVVIHSATKYIGGHGTTIGGAIIDSGQFPWEQFAARHRLITEPDPSYHGRIWTDIAKPFGPIAYVFAVRAGLLRDLGPAIAPQNAFQLIQGLETLPLRIRQHSENAAAVAKFLDDHPKVETVIFPGLQNGEARRRADAYLKGGFGGLVGFELTGGTEAGRRFIDALKLFFHVANIGDAHSLAIHPASTTHAQLSPEEQIASGVTPGYVRLSVGIENIADIIADITQALDEA